MKVSQLCPILCDPMNYTVHGILQARMLEWVAISFSREKTHEGVVADRWTLAAPLRLAPLH